MNNLPISCADDALKIGRMIARSGTFGVETDEGGAVIALMCYQEGMSLLQFHRTYNMVGNRPSMRADTMLAKFMELGGDFDIVQRDEDKAVVRLRRKDKEALEFSLTFDEVKKAGYCYSKDGKTLSKNWQVRPRNMLWARVVSDGIRTVDPRVNAGIYTEEEVVEFDPADSPPPGDPKPKQLKDTPEASTKASDPFQDMPSSPVDFAVVPIGAHAGKKWTELNRETLEKVIKNPKTLTPEHLKEVQKALDNAPF